jgi:hypothetical protein
MVLGTDPKIQWTADPSRNRAFQEQEEKLGKKIEFYVNRYVFFLV